MKYKLAIFDLDGTILDTLDDLADSLNYALEKTGYPVRTREEVRRFVGNGIRKLVERGVPSGTSAESADKVYESFTEHYKVHCADKTKPYEDIPELLKKLRENGVKTAVVSNKADYAVQNLCVQYFDGLFDAAAGEREGVRRKPSPDSVNIILEKLGVNRENAVYIGDSDVDVETARNSGMDCIAVDWGFRDKNILVQCGAKIIVSEPMKIAEIVLQ